MTRFWKREDRSIEQLLRANRPEPRDELSSSILQSISETPLRTAPRRAHSGRRLGLALALTVAALSLASVLGGISAASAGLGGIVRVATNAVTPSHTQSNTAGGSVNDNANDGDHHQYQVGLCHWANHKYVLIFVSPQGAANHLKNHPNDKLPFNGHC